MTDSRPAPRTAEDTPTPLDHGRTEDIPAFCLLLKGGRQDAGLTQAAAAEIAGVSENHWWRLEKGMCRPKRATLLKLAAVVPGLAPTHWTEPAGCSPPPGPPPTVSRADVRRLERRLKEQSKILRDIRECLARISPAVEASHRPAR